MIVIDAQNIAMKHGKDKVFSVKGIQIAVNYWNKNGHRVVGFLPEYLFDYEEVANQKKMKDMGLKDVKPQKIPDDVILMNKLKQNDFLISTPSQDYDDSYCIQYARKMNAYMVTNDKFRDYIEGLQKALDQEASPQGKGKKKKKQLDAIILDKSSINKE